MIRDALIYKIGDKWIKEMNDKFVQSMDCKVDLKLKNGEIQV